MVEAAASSCASWVSGTMVENLLYTRGKTWYIIYCIVAAEGRPARIGMLPARVAMANKARRWLDGHVAVWRPDKLGAKETRGTQMARMS